MSESASQSKITKSIDKQVSIDEKFPVEQAKIEAPDAPKVEKEDKSDQDKTTKKELDQAFETANQDGYQNKKKFFYDPVVSFNGKIKISKPQKHVRVEYETINDEKRRYCSGYRKIISLEEYYRLNGSEKIKLQGAKEPFILFPKMGHQGNIPYVDTNAVAGKKRRGYSSAIYANDKNQ